MKLSDSTVSLLKSFANINQGIIIHAGDVITSASPSQGLFAKAKVKDTFTNKMSIFALSEFLNMLAMFKNAEILIEDETITIKEGAKKVVYVQASESLIATLDPKKKAPNLEVLAKFNLSLNDLISVRKSSQYLKVNDLLLKSDGQTLIASVFDSENPSSSKFDLDIQADVEKSFNVYLDIGNLKLVDGSFDVEVTERLVHFTLLDSEIDLEYWIAINSKSEV